ncbi:DNA primase [Xanthomonas phaseoli pv. phaseoli]|uniref:glycoside hydrolase family 19 protein n=1 Tax=Xanthomonas phaseoli TaxID=1985254 RepID=UPI00059627DB|nr:glycoside hydrolase family 19 protein [Xanthomonas phaseoli]KIJ00471.1 DNA primase [Xanthomonas phaseoli pv. phaseoli]UZB30931.1 glycoside hydrolase family 19 protein [Xanthomonas phaseoli pv. phaseoli]
MQLTAQQLKQAVGCSDQTAERWIEPISEARRLYGISTPRRMAAFLAQVGHESAGLTAVVEGLNYSLENLTAVCKRAAPGSRWRSLLPRVKELARNSFGLGNAAYANRLGNGDEASGDGYRYRGRGPIQNTGRANYAGMRDTLRAKGVRDVPDFEKQPEMLEQPKWGALAAAAFWDTRNLNPLADAGRFDDITERVNGGQNGAADRRARYAKALKALGA